LDRGTRSVACPEANDPEPLGRVRARASGIDLSEQPHHLATDFRVHRGRVDHVGPAVAVGIAVSQQLGGDLVAVGLVEDQEAAQLVPRSGRQLQQTDRGGRRPQVER
jgi:hypothetical protein